MGVIIMRQGLQCIKSEANLTLWAEQVQVCRSSGLSVNEWRAENGIKPNAYYRRQKKVFTAVCQRNSQFYKVTMLRNSGHIAVSIQAEGAFAMIKEDMGFCRFMLRSFVKVEVDWMLLSIAYDLLKLHHKKQKQRLGSGLRSYWIFGRIVILWN